MYIGPNSSIINSADTGNSIRFTGDTQLGFYHGGVYANLLITDTSIVVGLANNLANTGIDFYVPSETRDHMFYVNASEDKVGIGTKTASTDKTLTVVGDVSFNSGSLQLSGSASSSLKVNTSISGGLFITASGFSDAFGGVHISGSVFHTGSTFSIGSENDDGFSALNVSGSISASGDMYLSIDGKLYLDNDRDTYIYGAADDAAVIKCGSVEIVRIAKNAVVGNNLDVTGHLFIDQTKKIGLDGVGGHTYIDEESDDRLRFTVGGDEMLILDEANDTITMDADLVVGTLGVSSGYVSASNGALEISGSGLGLTVGSWTDGYHGNDTFIPILPIDFTGGNTVAGRDTQINADGGLVHPSHPAAIPIAQKTIPRGFTATHVDVYGANNEDFDVYKGEIDNDTTPQVDGGSCVMNSTYTLTEPVSGSDGTQYLTVNVQIDNVNDTIYGGKITITRTL